MALSAWALPKQDLPAHVGASPTAQARPFLICHGEADGVVTFPNGQAVAAMLQVVVFELKKYRISTTLSAEAMIDQLSAACVSSLRFHFCVVSVFDAMNGLPTCVQPTPQSTAWNS